MKRKYGWRVLFVLLATCIGATLLPADEAPKKPKLAVILVFDQLRGDYLDRWKELYGEGGFKRLMTESAWFTNCHYPYTDTLTAPGHASLATGTTPDRHGIIANEWYDRIKGESITSVEDERFQIVPTPTTKVPGASPWRRREETVGDVLLRMTKNAKVASLSIKDRAAILLAALRAQICYWFSTHQGGFVTSTYYRDQPHSWVNAFNKTRPADRWIDDAWVRLRPDLDYAKFSGPDDVVVEGVGYQQGNTFPHVFAKAKAKSDKDYYSAVTNSPQGNDLLWALAKTCIDAEKLGQGDETDLLCLSFSCNDLIGHCWGPDSQEVLDVTLRTDRLVKELLDFLDAKVGRGNYVVALSADHGVCPIPEITAQSNKDAGRVAPEALKAKAAEALQDAFAKDRLNLPWIEASYGPWIYLNRATLKEAKVSQEQAEKVVADALGQVPGVLAAFTRTQIKTVALVNNPLLARLRLSFHPDNSGDVMVMPKSHYLISGSITSEKALAYRTTHGSPHPYDTHVPLLVMGPGIQAGIHRERVTPQALAPILTEAMRLPPPAGATVPVPPGTFSKR